MQPATCCKTHEEYICLDVGVWTVLRRQRYADDNAESGKPDSRELPPRTRSFDRLRCLRSQAALASARSSREANRLPRVAAPEKASMTHKKTRGDSELRSINCELKTPL